MWAGVAVEHARTSATIEANILLVIASSFAVSANADWVTSNPSNCARATSSPPPLAGEGQVGGTQYDRAFQFTPPSPLLPRWPVTYEPPIVARTRPTITK